MALDKEKIRFKGKLISAAHRRNASVDDDEAKSFVEAIYGEWRDSGVSLEQVDTWLDRKLEGLFLHLNQPPVWAEAEPSWPFVDGKPMVFVSQTSMGETDLTAAHLSPGETIYVFGARRQEADGFRMVYRIVSQFSD